MSQSGARNCRSVPTQGEEGVWGKASNQRLEQAHLRGVQAVPGHLPHSAQHAFHLRRQLAMPRWQGACRQPGTTLAEKRLTSHSFAVCVQHFIAVPPRCTSSAICESAH